MALPAIRACRLAADVCWPGNGRGRVDPRRRTGASTPAGRRCSARRRYRPRAPAAGRPASARPRSAVEACVPLMSASPSLGASVHRRRGRRARSAAAPGSGAPSCHASPSPIRTSARWASGARSPLAPTDPRDGTTGCTPLVEQLQQPFERLEPNPREPLRQHVGAQRQHARGRRGSAADRRRRRRGCAAG